MGAIAALARRLTGEARACDCLQSSLAKAGATLFMLPEFPVFARRIPLSIALTLAAALAAACGDDAPESQRPPTLVQLAPPTSLELDGQTVSRGDFVVTDAMAHTFAGTSTRSRDVVSPSSPVTVNATMGTGVHDLFEVDSGTQALDIRGYFRATDPELPPAHFNVTIFGDFSAPVEMTVLLPAQTSETTNQITGARVPPAESTTVVTDQEVPVEAYGAIAASGGSDPGDIGSSSIVSNVPRSPVRMVEHGRVRAVPGIGGAGGRPGGGGAGTGTGGGGGGGVGRVCSGSQPVGGGRCSGLEYCIDGPACYYLADGRRFDCNCTDLTDCATRVANYCTGL